MICPLCVGGGQAGSPTRLFGDVDVKEGANI